MYCLHAVFGPDNFSCEKKNPEFFFGQKILPVRVIRCFHKNPELLKKIHVGEKSCELVVHPTVG
jgi:hypothetical protein